MHELGYNSNKSILRDHIVRAITLRYLLKKTDISYYNQQLKTDQTWGFAYIKNILTSLEIYESNRTQYRSLEEFYPIIIENMKKEYQKIKTSKRKLF